MMNKTYTTLELGRRTFILTAGEDRSASKNNWENANFRGTGMALAGVLGKKESFAMWMRKHGK
jgi:hypothetical protein